MRPMRNFPDEDFGMSGHRSLPRNRERTQMSGSGGDNFDNLSDNSSSGSGGDNDMGIPIRVIHEKPGKQRYGQVPGRNTTELPAKASSAGQGSESPRLERAASEPPNKFKQRLNINSSAVPTIPENSDMSSNSNYPKQQSHSSMADRNPIKTSASAPSVPGSYPDSQPTAPQRRSPPRAMPGAGQPTNSNANVRHIPIFVEGRPEPIFNQNLNSTQELSQPREQNHDLPFSKPSDYYPPGVQRVKSKEDPVPEPTTPMGPPPGPIPMGYLPPQQQTLKPEQPTAEPTTPQGPPPGPIPMGFVPREEASDLNEPDQPPVPPQRHRTPNPTPAQPQDTVQPQRKISEASDQEPEHRKSPVVNVIPIKVDQGKKDASPKQSSKKIPDQEPKKSPSTSKKHETQQSQNPKIMKLEKIKEDVENLTSKIDNFQGSKTDKEYLYLEEMLTRHLIALDGIEPEGETEIRQMRKESINSVNRCLSLLDRKVSEVNDDAAANDEILSELVQQSNKNTEKKNEKSSL